MGDPVIDAMNQMVSELGEPDLEATGLVKVYGDRTVVNGMNVNCRCGEIVGLLGPNGAGKTTTFYMIVGLVKPNEGKVTFRGRDLTNMPVFLRARRGIGYLAQEASIFRKLSVWNNVMAILETLKLSSRERKARCEELLSTFDLMKVAKQPAYTLSGGERRKLEIARALVRRPAILILDDSASALDFATDAALRKALAHLPWKPTVVLISQRVSSIRHADQILVLDDGRLAGTGTHDELLQSCPVYQEICRSQYKKEDAQ